MSAGRSERDTALIDAKYLRVRYYTIVSRKKNRLADRSGVDEGCTAAFDRPFWATD